MPQATRQWLQRFVDGINHYQATTEALPQEYAVLGLEREPWTPADVLTFGRLAGSDVSWLVVVQSAEAARSPRLAADLGADAE